MQITKQPEPLEFKWKDVTIAVRARATNEDRFEINMLYDVDKKGSVRIPRESRRDFYRTLISRFVVSWKGVTDEKDAEVPFSMETFFNLPPDPQDDIVLLLGAFIYEKTGIALTHAEEKKTKN